MAVFLDGPAKGVRLNLRRLPRFLRVVHDIQSQEFDALDQLDDTPRETERIFVYRRQGEPVRGFVCGRGIGCRPVVDADYRIHSEQPEDETLRDNESWRAWAMGVEDG